VDKTDHLGMFVLLNHYESGLIYSWVFNAP